MHTTETTAITEATGVAEANLQLFIWTERKYFWIDWTCGDKRFKRTLHSPMIPCRKAEHA